MAGYSGTPLPKKLGLKPGCRFGVVAPPPEFAGALGELPEGVTTRDARRSKGPFDVIVAFVTEVALLQKLLVDLRPRFEPDGALWIAWPKRASGVRSDVSENLVRELALAARLVDVKVCAIDATWSGLKLVVRVKDRK